MGEKKFKPFTRLSGKEYSPLTIRRYSTPVLHFVAMITDDNLDSLDSVMKEIWSSMKDLPESIQEWRNLAGHMVEALLKTFTKSEGIAVIIVADKMIISSLYGDFMNHEQCRLELYSLLNFATNV